MSHSPADAPSFDLQAHSTYSDGELSPAQTVRAAAAAGVELFALTDHDSVDGVAEAAEMARHVGIRLVPAVEISALDRVCHDLHIAGYLIDPDDAALGAQLERSRGDRALRSERMIEALKRGGWAVDHGPLDARQAAGAALGRPHLAQAVLSHPDNTERLAQEQLTNPSSFLEAYLIDGKPAYVERGAPPVANVLDVIHGAGGVAVWAHPFWDVDSDAEVVAAIERFAEMGLDGVEVFYLTHTRAQVDLLAQCCAELGLITTGSADFHGPSHRIFNRFRAFKTYGHVANLGPIAG
ncbi:MAG: PHP domain-containing protein [Conexibacteraceae bacterium]|nr:PHP domain-containing protein [Conexibacteraceae bacterium]